VRLPGSAVIALAVKTDDGESRGWDQRTVNPLMVPARYDFLYSSQGRPPAAAVLAPATTRRSPENRLTLPHRGIHGEARRPAA